MGTIILKLFTLAVLLYCMNAMATLSAKDDYSQIKNNEYVYHKTQWIIRALISTLLCAGLTVFLGSWLIFVYYLIISAFTFSFIFRDKLNALRKLPYDYISKSNIYDSVFIALAGKKGGKLAYIFEGFTVIIFAILSLIKS